MRTRLQLAAALLLIGAATARAQITNPDDLVAPLPRNPASHHRPVPATDNLQWFWQFTKPEPNGRASDLRVDARFQAMLARDFKQPQAMWGPDNAHSPLALIAPLFLSRYGVVTAERNRYITVDGCVPSFCAAHGMLWADLGSPHPLVVFIAVNWNTEGKTANEPGAHYNLWLFPNRTLDPDALPLALTESISHWDARLSEAHRLVPLVTQAIIVQPDGQPAGLNPTLTGANTLPPQPDTVTPADADPL